MADGADISGVGLPELGPLTINGAATIRDCQLNGQLALGPGAAARLVGCNIQRPILVAAGGRLVVGASTFLTGQAFINNIGAAANCVSVGNVGWNPGPTPHVNTTIIGEV
ncbi:MAG: hypothetical protein FJ100_16255 [Deltaproteobacteria bacterium]|nr:hypothetical protein [Deltaproteobacteria bacterium]